MDIITSTLTMELIMAAKKWLSRYIKDGQVRYHITTPKRRTTVTLDKIISDLIAIKLGADPDDPESHGEVRRQLEHLLSIYHDPKSSFYDPGRMDAAPSRFVNKLAILWLVGQRLSDKYDTYVISRVDSIISN